MAPPLEVSRWQEVRSTKDQCLAIAYMKIRRRRQKKQPEKFDVEELNIPEVHEWSTSLYGIALMPLVRLVGGITWRRPQGQRVRTSPAIRNHRKKNGISQNVTHVLCLALMTPVDTPSLLLCYLVLDDIVKQISIRNIYYLHNLNIWTYYLWCYITIENSLRMCISCTVCVTCMYIPCKRTYMNQPIAYISFNQFTYTPS